jgi:hypothetical protein
MRLRLGIVAAFIALLAIVGLVWWSATRPAPIEQAVATCTDRLGRQGMHWVASDGESVVVEMSGERSQLAGACVLTELGMPRAFVSRMASEDAGSAERDGLSYSWSTAGSTTVVTVTD